jgi:hypothetical protein
MTDPQQPEQPSGGPGTQAQGLAESRDEAGKAAAPNTEAQGAQANGTETKAATAQDSESKSPEAKTSEIKTSETKSSEAGSAEANSASAAQPDAKSSETKSSEIDGSGSTENAEAKPADASSPEAKSPVPSSPSSSPASSPVPSSSAASGPETKGASTGSPAAGGSQSKKGNKGLLIGLSAAALVIVVLVLAAFVWPGFLAGPGKPDAKATEAAAALGSKDAGQLDKVACHGPDGKSSGQLPPQVLQLIQSAAQTGPPVLTLDTQARVPVDLTLSAQGQTQKIPVDLVLGVTNHAWCMDGIAQRQ